MVLSIYEYLNHCLRPKLLFVDMSVKLMFHHLGAKVFRRYLMQ